MDVISNTKALKKIFLSLKVLICLLRQNLIVQGNERFLHPSVIKHVMGKYNHIPLPDQSAILVGKH